MRLLLDEHVSGPRIGRKLAEAGHDVLAVDQEDALTGASDEDLLELSAEVGRVLVTFDISDFPRVLADWGRAGRSHAGVILVFGFRHGDFGDVLRGIELKLGRRPTQENWIDAVEVISPGGLAGTGR